MISVKDYSCFNKLILLMIKLIVCVWLLMLLIWLIDVYIENKWIKIIFCFLCEL